MFVKIRFEVKVKLFCGIESLSRWMAYEKRVSDPEDSNHWQHPTCDRGGYGTIRIEREPNTAGGMFGGGGDSCEIVKTPEAMILLKDTQLVICTPCAAKAIAIGWLNPLKEET